MHMCVHICVEADTRIQVWVCRSQLWFMFLRCSSLYFEEGLSSVVHQLSWPGNWGPQGSTCLYFPTLRLQVWISVPDFFTWMLGIELMSSWEAPICPIPDLSFNALADWVRKWLSREIENLHGSILLWSRCTGEKGREKFTRFQLRTTSITQVVSQDVRNGELPSSCRVSQGIFGFLRKTRTNTLLSSSILSPAG